ncbi:MAG TPA: hypothetical protein VGD50_01465 [Candidatus Baltobacteraceae bacterium]
MADRGPLQTWLQRLSRNVANASRADVADRPLTLSHVGSADDLAAEIAAAKLRLSSLGNGALAAATAPTTIRSSGLAPTYPASAAQAAPAPAPPMPAAPPVPVAPPVSLAPPVSAAPPEPAAPPKPQAPPVAMTPLPLLLEVAEPAAATPSPEPVKAPAAPKPPPPRAQTPPLPAPVVPAPATPQALRLSFVAAEERAIEARIVELRAAEEQAAQRRHEIERRLAALTPSPEASDPSKPISIRIGRLDAVQETNAGK